jgi:hypothetical protein
MVSGDTDTLPKEKVLIPNGYNATKTANGGRESKMTESPWAEIVEISMVKRFSFSFLETNHITTRFINFFA